MPLASRLLLLALACAAAVAQTPDPISGTWTDGSATLQLARQSESSDYLIRARIDDQSFPGEASYDGVTLDGLLEVNGEDVYFQAKLAGAALLLELNGAVYTLNRTGAAQSAVAAEHEAPVEAAQFGDFRFALPAGWRAQAHGAEVTLAPPNPAADGSEAYVLTFVSGIDNPSDPRAAALVQQFLGELAPLAQNESAEIVAAGRAVTMYSYLVPQAQKRIRAYMRARGDGLIVAFAVGNDAKVAGHDAALRVIAATADYDAPATPSPATSSADGETLSLKTDANAPPFQAGRTSDGKPQSNQWVQRLQGMLLTQISSYSTTGGGYNSKDRTLLYRDGRFEGAGMSSVSVDVGSSAATGGTHQAVGWWRVVTVNNLSYLGLAVPGLPQEIYSLLEARGSETYVDGTRTYVTVP